jgi:hypothetical protein
MSQNLSREFRPFHYVAGNRIADESASSSRAQEMTMLMLSLVRTLAALVPLAAKLATWLVARSLNMPEPLVHATGIFMFVQVQAFETSVGRSLCPIRLARRVMAWFR